MKVKNDCKQPYIPNMISEFWKKNNLPLGAIFAIFGL